MTKLFKKNPVLHALAWIGIYIMCVNIFESLSIALGQPTLFTSIGLGGVSILLVLYLKHQNSLAAIGFQKIKHSSLKRSLYFIPLITLSLIQFFGSFNTELALPQILITGLLMLNVGIIEEVIFRGLLYKAIRDKSGRTRAILISGFTFGLGHIINLLRGMSIENQVEQIGVAIIIGIMLALIVELTKSIIPGILFHVLFNFSSTIMIADSTAESYLLVSILTLATLYATYLVIIQYRKGEISLVKCQ